jgi:hypothetical protein
MSAPFITAPPGVFDFLRLPPELRYRIYQVHLSEEGDVSYQTWSRESGLVTHDEPMEKTRLGVNIFRVCSQIYHEAVTFAYADRHWDLGRTLPVGPYKLAIDCAQRVSCVPHDTVGRIQNLGLTLAFGLSSQSCVVTSVEMGDLTKLKSLRGLELFLDLDKRNEKIPSWLRRPDVTLRDSPLFIGLVCQILSQIPTQVEFELWPLVGADWDAREQRELDRDIDYIARTFLAIQGCNCATST